MSKNDQKPKRKRPRGAGRTDYNTPLTQEQKAAIWQFAEEGFSQRETARQLKISPSIVSRTLALDPIALDALRARLAEERAARWKQVETAGLDELIGWLQRTREFRTGKRRRSEKANEEFDALPKYLTALRGVAEAGTRQTQLLTGGATDRFQQIPTDEALTDEQLIAQAVELDSIDILPVRLRAAARKLKGDQ